MARIKVGCRFAIVDDEDFERLSQYKWHCIRKNRSYGEAIYAARAAKRKDGAWTTVYMHQDIVAAPDGFEIDHKSHDTLDNRKSNLRLATRAQNAQNAIRPPRNLPRGVYLTPHNRFRVIITANGRRYNVGSFATPEEAKAAWDRAANDLHGEFAFKEVI